MMDKGRKLCDKRLQKIESKITKEYEKALKDMQKKSRKYFERFREQDEIKRDLVEKGQLEKELYIGWRKNKFVNGQYYNDMISSLSQSLQQARQSAEKIINNNLPYIYAESSNFAAYQVENKLKINAKFALVDQYAVKELLAHNTKLLPKPTTNIAKVNKWNRQKLNSAILQGILQGESIPNIARRLKRVSNMSKAASIRNARTMTTAAENRGRVDSYKDAEKKGIQLHQRWMAVHDDRTRDSHRLMDGEVQKIGERFSNGCRYPADPTGEPSEVYNCRCSLEAVIDDYPDDYYANFQRVGDMSYEEWKSSKRKKGDSYD